MNVLLQLGFYLSLSYFGEQLSAYLPFPIPGSVLAMLLVLILLKLKWLKVEQLEQCSHFLLSYMGLLFVPATVGIMENIGVIAERLWPFLVVVILCTLITLLSTMLVTQGLMKLQKGGAAK